MAGAEKQTEERRHGYGDFSEALESYEETVAENTSRISSLEKIVEEFREEMSGFKQQLQDHAEQSSAGFECVNGKLDPIHDVITKARNFVEVLDWISRGARRATKPIIYLGIICGALVSVLKLYEALQ